MGGGAIGVSLYQCLTWSSGSSTAAAWTRSGPATSPISAPARAGSTCARSAMHAPGGSSDWAIEDHMRADLVEAALQMAVTLRGQLPDKVIFHAARSVHLSPNRRSRNWSGRVALDGTHRRVLGQRGRGVVLIDLQNRVLQPLSLGHQGRGQDGLHTLDRGTIQPQKAALPDRHAHPRTLRTGPTSDGTSRLITCPPFGVNPTTPAGFVDVGYNCKLQTLRCRRGWHLAVHRHEVGVDNP